MIGMPLPDNRTTMRTDLGIRRNTMRVYLAACVALVLIAACAAVVLNAVNEPVSQAFASEPSVRI